MERTVLPNREAVLWLRKSRGWSQNQFAAHVGLDVRVVRKLEEGRPVYPVTLKAVADEFHVDLEILVNSLTPDPVNLRDFPMMLHRLIERAQDAELCADFGRAAELFQEALRSKTVIDADKLAKLHERLAVNIQLGDLQRMAYKGMREPRIAYFESNRQLAFAPKDVVHQRGLVHPTVILLFKSVTGNVAWYQRTEGQQFPGRRDFFGGHVLKGDKSPKETAIREANEELRLYAGATRIPFLEEWFDQIGREFEFEWQAAENKERSTVFVVELPGHPALSITACDEDLTGRRIVNIPVVRFAPLGELAEQFQRDADSFADGATRVLTMYLRNERVRKALMRFFPVPFRPR